MPFPMYSAGTPVSPLPIVGRRAHLPSNTLTAHLADAADPHGVRALVPALRAGSGAPSVEPADKATDFYFDTAGSLLYVMEEVSGTRSWAAVAPGLPSSFYVVKGDKMYLRSQIVNGVQHYVEQTMEFDPDIGWGANWTGDYILDADGEFVPAN